MCNSKSCAVTVRVVNSERGEGAPPGFMASVAREFGRAIPAAVPNGQPRHARTGRFVVALPPVSIKLGLRSALAMVSIPVMVLCGSAVARADVDATQGELAPRATVQVAHVAPSGHGGVRVCNGAMTICTDDARPMHVAPVSTTPTHGAL